jgi:hypothetical protein
LSPAKYGKKSHSFDFLGVFGIAVLWLPRFFEMILYAGHNDLTNDFVTGWLEEFIPPLTKEIMERGTNPNFVRYSSP